jgi:hypothetical protein
MWGGYSLSPVRPTSLYILYSVSVHVTDDEGHCTDVLLEQEASCSRHEVKLGCDIYNQPEEVIERLLDLPHKCDSLSKVGLSFHLYCHLNNFFSTGYLCESVLLYYQHLSYI